MFCHKISLSFCFVFINYINFQKELRKRKRNKKKIVLIHIKTHSKHWVSCVHKPKYRL